MRPTILFVEIFQYLWIYQKPRVLSNPVRHSDRRHLTHHETSSPGGGRNRLRETEVGVLEKRELNLVVLADEHQCCRGIKTLETNKRISTTDDELGL